MRVLYAAPRYHTNQIPVMKGWLQNGDQVMFLSQFLSTPEDYSVLKPEVLGYSTVFNTFIPILLRLKYGKKWTEAQEYALRIKIGFPPLGKMKKLFREFNPELAILRERSLYNIPIYLYCSKHKIACILYNQSPLWDYPDRDKGLGHKILIRFLPKFRMTPVKGVKEKNKIKTPYSEYIPFVIEPHMPPFNKKYFPEGKIRVLCVGSYEERKNLIMLVGAVKSLVTKYNLHITIIGEAVGKQQEEYYERLQKVISENGFKDDFTLLKNMNRDQMYEKYETSDLFVLPSTKERASVSQLEAMSCSVGIICSNTNGSSCYVEDGRNGYLFQDNDEKDLQDKIEKCVSQKEILLKMGEESYHLVVNKYGFKKYHDKLLNLQERSIQILKK